MNTLAMQIKDFAWITVPMLDPEDPQKRIHRTLPFLDPHEYIEFVWATERIYISDEEILLLDALESLCASPKPDP